MQRNKNTNFVAPTQENVAIIFAMQHPHRPAMTAA